MSTDVDPRTVFYIPPNIHRKAFPYAPPGDASSSGYMLPEGIIIMYAFDIYLYGT